MHTISTGQEMGLGYYGVSRFNAIYASVLHFGKQGVHEDTGDIWLKKNQLFLRNTSRPHQYRLGINWRYFLPA